MEPKLTGNYFKLQKYLFSIKSESLLCLDVYYLDSSPPLFVTSSIGSFPLCFIPASSRLLQPIDKRHRRELVLHTWSQPIPDSFSVHRFMYVMYHVDVLPGATPQTGVR